MTTQNAKNVTLAGVVLGWDEPVDNKPGKMRLETADGPVMLNIWPDNVGILQKLDMSRIEGAHIQALARYSDTRNGEIRYRPSKITLLDAVPDGAPPTPKSAPQSASTPPSMDQNQMRIMRQSTLHYASILIAPMVKDFETPQLMAERTIELAGKLLEYVISGENPFAEAEESSEPQQEDEPPVSSVQRL